MDSKQLRYLPEDTEQLRLWFQRFPFRNMNFDKVSQFTELINFKRSNLLILCVGQEIGSAYSHRLGRVHAFGHCTLL